MTAPNIAGLSTVTGKSVGLAFTTSFAEIAPVLPVAMSESANAWPIFISSSSENLFPCFRGDPASDFFLFLPFSPPGESDKSVVRQVLSTYFSIFSKGHV